MLSRSCSTSLGPLSEALHSTPPLNLVQVQGESITYRPGRVRCSSCTAGSCLLISHLNLRLVVPDTNSPGRSDPCARSWMCSCHLPCCLASGGGGSAAAAGGRLWFTTCLVLLALLILSSSLAMSWEYNIYLSIFIDYNLHSLASFQPFYTAFPPLENMSQLKQHP